MIIRSYSELSSLATYEERFDYLQLRGKVGGETFGFERWINQRFYRSTQWKQVRNHVIARDLGNDLGSEGFPIFDRIIIHHMNPMTPEDIVDGNPDILNPEYLITTNHNTHNAIHYGDKTLLPGIALERTPGDTTLWRSPNKERYDL